ncbi:cilia- and flagella-associated protein 44-like [Anneissia japonica]|uniref:cilia- and flagella-associated protein 44-like n=1 Tax=Anneissia japonica TaxID=1529436 RepID=UPI0014256801|nr:cilia- and flagella-associated protein 44-like [Anneissia japonica]
MADNDNNLANEGEKGNVKKSLKLKDATHKLTAEALRQYKQSQLYDGDASQTKSKPEDSAKTPGEEILKNDKEEENRNFFDEKKHEVIEKECDRIENEADHQSGSTQHTDNNVQGINESAEVLELPTEDVKNEASNGTKDDDTKDAAISEDHGNKENKAENTKNAENVRDPENVENSENVTEEPKTSDELKQSKNMRDDGGANNSPDQTTDINSEDKQTTLATNVSDIQDDTQAATGGVEANANVNNSADDKVADTKDEDNSVPLASGEQEERQDDTAAEQEATPMTDDINETENLTIDGADGGVSSKSQKADGVVQEKTVTERKQNVEGETGKGNLESNGKKDQESKENATVDQATTAASDTLPVEDALPAPPTIAADGTSEPTETLTAAAELVLELTAQGTNVSQNVDREQPGDEGTIEPATEEVNRGDEQQIPTNFFYDVMELQSVAKISEDSGLPKDMLKIHHSFGYDCLKHHNLLMLDGNTLLFIAGNMVQLLNIVTKEQKYLRSTSGGGIGAIAVHPSGKYFAIAEKGVLPNINIYEFPSLRLYRILREGTETAYAHIDFNPSGTLLASVGSSPDFMLTLWNWTEEMIMLRSKAFSQDVFRVTFSPDNEGQLTTSGIGHIRFWKMANTFTGLKLQGQLGKFGRTAISDIRGYVELPDGKVLSGTEWGNMLLWDGGLIKVQISRKHKKHCHAGPIEQFVMDEGELITIGADGFIRVWDFESIDTADSPDDSGIFEMEPMNELKVGNDVYLRSMIKSLDPEVQSIWFAQDANGAIWKLDLSFSHTTKDPERLFSFHSGAINQTVSSTVSQLVATTGADHTVRVYDYSSKKPLCQTRFNAGGSSLLWIPEIIDPKGRTILAGFEDGVVRVLTVSKRDPKNLTPVKWQSQATDAQLLLKQAFKPQSSKVTSMAIDSKGEFLCTGGADSTVFFMTIGDVYKPIGFVDVPGPVTHMTWSPSHYERNTVLVFCANGEVVEIEAPDADSYDTSKTFRLNNVKMRNATFKSVKSKLRRKEEEKRREEEEEKRRIEEEKQRRIRRERGIESDDEDDDKKEKEEEELLPPLFIPEEASPIHCGFYTPNDPNKFWVSMGGYDAGYLYECEFPDEKKNMQLKRADREEDIGDPTQAVPVVDSNDTPITNITFSKNGQQVIFGFEDGSIRIQSVNQEGLKVKPNYSQGDLSNLGPHWTLTVHDNNYGKVTSVETSMDDRYIFTTGTDGNFFVYELMTQEQIEEAKAIARAKIPSAKKEDLERKADDIESKDHYSIEVEKQKAEHDKMMKLAEEKKVNVRRTIAKLRRQFKKLLDTNSDLPEHLQLERKEFEMDPEIKKDMERQTAQRIELVRKELAWETEKHQISLDKLKKRFKDELECERITVISIQSSHEVSTFRTSELSEEFYELKEDMISRQATRTERGLSRDTTREALMRQAKRSESESDTMIGLGAQDHKKATVLTGRLGEKIANALQKAEKIKKKREARQAQWDELHAHKPPEDYEDPNDIRAIKEAQEHMGDFKLKTAKDYVVPEHLRMNALKKRNQLIILKELIHQHQYEFNCKVIALRNKKVRMITDIKDYLQELVELQKNLPPEQCKMLPTCPELHPCEVPEKKFEFTRESLIKFKEEMAVRAVNKIKGVESGGFGGFGGFGGAGTAPPTAEPTKQDTGTPSKASTPLAAKQVSSMSIRSSGVSFETLPSSDKALSALEQQLLKVNEIRVLFRQDTILKKIDELIRNFDAELRILRHYKFREDIDLKNAELRQVTLFEELHPRQSKHLYQLSIVKALLFSFSEQLEKQQKLNELDIVVTLKLHQVEHVVNGALPQDLTSTLVFTNTSMIKLQRRITELKEEKTTQRRLYKEHRQQHVRLIKERKLMETRIVELEEQCKEAMIQKFGCVVDLEKIETIGVNRNIEELKERIRQNELANSSDIQKWQEKIESKKDRITELTRENTEAIRRLTMLLGENEGLEKALDSRQKTLSLGPALMGGEFQGSRKADLEEKQRLIQLVQLQAQEIEALKEEISLLSRKGGHILPPTQPPMPPTPHANRQVVSSSGPT